MLLSLGIIVFLPFLDKIVSSLLLETQDQLDQDTYNRWTALQYFLFDVDQTWYAVLVGNGVAGYGGGDYANKVMQIGSMGGFLADIGLVGTYWYFGIFPIIFLVICTFMSFHKNIPTYLKIYSLFFWLVPNQHNFMHPYVNSNMAIVVYVYLLFYYYYNNNTDYTLANKYN